MTDLIEKNKAFNFYNQRNADIDVDGFLKLMEFYYNLLVRLKFLSVNFLYPLKVEC